MSKVEYLEALAVAQYPNTPTVPKSDLLRTIRQDDQDKDLFCDCCGKPAARLFVVNTPGVLENMNLCLESFLKEVDRGEI